MLTWVEIKQSAIRHNLSTFRRLIGKGVLLMPVIKSNAYGHGFLEVAGICNSDKNVDRICVVSGDEAEKLLNTKIVQKKIMVLSYYDLDNFHQLELLVKHGVVLPLYRLDQISKLEKIGKRLKKNITIHLKVDTGTSRVGFLKNKIPKVSAMLQNKTHLQVEGVWSHFASSEDDPTFTKIQYQNFLDILDLLRYGGIEPKLLHMACTSASLGFSFDKLSAMRLGLGLYGLYPSTKGKNSTKLKPALSWKTRIIQLKTVPAGAKIGYGGTYVAKKPTTIAILPVGYWDGYDRSFSNQSVVIIRGQKCSVRGRICMNLCMVEIPASINAKIGDMVTLLGTEKKAAITADNLADIAGTINYEVVTRINPLIPRIVV